MGSTETVKDPNEELEQSAVYDGPPPGPRGYPFLSVLPRIWKDPLRFFVDMAAEHGDIALLGVGKWRFYLVTGPEHVKTILQENHRNFWKGTGMDSARPVMGSGLATSDGPFWRDQRRIIQPEFNLPRVQSLVPRMVEQIEWTLDRWKMIAARDETVDMAREMNHLSQRLIFDTLFGIDIGDRPAEVYDAVTESMEYIQHRAWGLWKTPEHWPTPRNRRFRRASELLDSLMFQAIRENRERSTKSTKSNGASESPPDNLVATLVNARVGDGSERMPDQQIRDELMTIFVAGHDTTASALAWTWYLLSKHPQAMTLLKAEVDAVLGGREPTVQDLPDLKYTRMVIEESMRLYPPGWILVRTPREDDVVGGYHIPKDAPVLLSPYVTHRLPEYWQDPESFRPERFSPEESAGRPKFAFFPFGGGPRICLGNILSMVEMQLVLACVLQRFSPSLVSEQTIRPSPSITLRPSGAVRMRLC
jgi:cytochrome P450